jgi:hypothetical protein
MAEKLFRNPTRVTPEINFDPELQKFTFIGISRPEDAYEFYDPILTWCDEYTVEVFEKYRENKLPGKTFTLLFDFKYMNSASSKYIFQILSSFRRMHEYDLKLNVSWYYEDADDQILEDGEDFSEILNIPFKFIERNK